MKNPFPASLLLAVLVLLGCKTETKSANTPGTEIEEPRETAQPAPETQPAPGGQAIPEREPAPEAMTAHNSRISVDWPGTYKGTLPCTDCEGIKVSLTLFENGDFTRDRTYLGTSEDVTSDSGTFSWNEAGSTITLGPAEGPSSRYQVGENILFKLDPGGNRYSGSQAGAYELHKNRNDSLLEDRRWVLTELRGQTVRFGEGEKQAFLTFHSALGQLTGNNSCNVLVADYALRPGNRITFSRMAGTQKACPGTDIPVQMQEVLETVDNYTVKDGVLSLNKARMAPLARFAIPGSD